MIRNDVLKMVKIELAHTDADKPKFHSTHEGYAVLKEEVDELWDEIKVSKSYNANMLMVKEAVQVAAMAIKFIENLYQTKHITFDPKLTKTAFKSFYEFPDEGE